MKILRKIIEINEDKCDGCGNCVVSCAEGAILIIDGKAKVIKDMFCDGLGACMGSCPQDALRIVEREADPFDEEAVHRHLEEMKNKKPAGGCLSSAVMSLKPMITGIAAPANHGAVSAESRLSNWPVKIRLVPPDAPYLKNADILVLADCAAAAYANLHSDFIKDRIVMMGCPKFDDSRMHVEKLAQIFSVNEIKSITIARMEVPCCAGMAVLVREALRAAKTDIPVSEEIITRNGGHTQAESLQKIGSHACSCAG